MSYPSTRDAAFIATAVQWITDGREVLALVRFSHAAGAKDFAFLDSLESLTVTLSKLPSRACITLFKEPQLPLRGSVDDDLIAQALAMVPEGVEALVVGLEQIEAGGCAWYPHRTSETSMELREILEELRGKPVAVGTYPPWLPDGPNVISAVVPCPDGSVTTGVY